MSMNLSSGPGRQLLGSDGSVVAAAVSSTAVILLSPDPSRRGGILYNDGAGVARISFGSTTPTASVGIPLAPGDWMPFEFRGQIRAIRQDSTDTTIQVQETVT